MWNQLLYYRYQFECGWQIETRNALLIRNGTGTKYSDTVTQNVLEYEKSDIFFFDNQGLKINNFQLRLGTVVIVTPDFQKCEDAFRNVLGSTVIGAWKNLVIDFLLSKAYSSLICKFSSSMFQNVQDAPAIWDSTF